jgi:hypothetical protein
MCQKADIKHTKIMKKDYSLKQIDTQIFGMIKLLTLLMFCLTVFNRNI